MARLPSIGTLWKQSQKNPHGRTRTISFNSSGNAKERQIRQAEVSGLHLSDRKGYYAGTEIYR